MSDLLGEIRRFVENFAGGASKALRLTGNESLAVAQTEPVGAEMTRSGRRYMLGNSAAITGIAPVQVLPTTAPQFSLWNTSSSKTMFIEELGMYLTSGTPGIGGILLACLYKLPASLGDTYAGTKISCLNNPADSGSALIVKTAVTITSPVAPNWLPVATNHTANVTAFAASTYLEHRDLQGRIAIPPLSGLGLAVVAPAGTNPLFAPFAVWSEFATDNE